MNSNQIELIRKSGKDFQEWQKSDEGKKSIDDHRKHLQFLQEKLSLNNLRNLTEDSLIEIYNELWANNNFQNKEWRCREKIIKPNGLDKIKTELIELLYGTGQISERYNRCAQQLKGVKKSTITEMLYCVDPTKYCLWNKAAEIFISKLELEEDISNLKSDGEKYEKILSLYSEVVNELKTDGIQDFFDLDTFMFYQFRDEPTQSIDKDDIWFWQVAAGKNEEFWNEFKNTNTIGVGWNKTGDLSKLTDKQRRVKFKNAGYTQGYTSLKHFLEIQPDDIVFVNKGKEGILAIGKVVGDYKFDQNSSYHHIIPVQWLTTEYLNVPVPWSGNAAVNRIRNKQMLQPYLNNLSKPRSKLDGIFNEHKQIVLYGPPGTGKTRTAKKLAIDEITNGLISTEDVDYAFDQLQKSAHVEIVQFHPSYSYEDFVEGIRPVVDTKDKSKLNYKVQDGIFKKLCNIANQSIQDAKEFDHQYAVISKYKSFSPIEPKNFGISPQQGGIHKISKSDFEKIVKHLKKEDHDTSAFNDLNSFSNFLILNSSDGSVYADVEGFWYHFSKYANAPVIMMASIKEGDTAFVYYKKRQGFAGIGIIKENALVTNPPFFLIIDEINRGDPSRIFGELIYGLEYRDRPITTQYAEFESGEIREKLVIPSNLYIIGTMNTADRSVSLFDIALRRRFAFKGLFPDYDLLSKELGFTDFADVKEQIKDVGKKTKPEQVKLLSIMAIYKINEKIIDPKEFKLGRERQVGHTYFLNLKAHPEKFVNIWKHDVIPLLEEYFFAKAGILENLLSEEIFTEKEGIKDFTEEQLITSLNSLISKSSV